MRPISAQLRIGLSIWILWFWLMLIRANTHLDLMGGFCMNSGSVIFYTGAVDLKKEALVGEYKFEVGKSVTLKPSHQAQWNAVDKEVMEFTHLMTFQHPLTKRYHLIRLLERGVGKLSLFVTKKTIDGGDESVTNKFSYDNPSNHKIAFDGDTLAKQYAVAKDDFFAIYLQAAQDDIINCIYHNGQYYFFFEGATKGGKVDQLYRVDPDTLQATWVATSGDAPRYQRGLTAMFLKEKSQVWLTGGADDLNPVDTLYSLDLDTLTWAQHRVPDFVGTQSGCFVAYSQSAFLYAFGKPNDHQDRQFQSQTYIINAEEWKLEPKIQFSYTSQSDAKGDRSLDTVTIVIISVGCGVALILVILLIYYLWLRRMNARSKMLDDQIECDSFQFPEYLSEWQWSNLPSTTNVGDLVGTTLATYHTCTAVDAPPATGRFVPDMVLDISLETLESESFYDLGVSSRAPPELFWKTRIMNSTQPSAHQI